MCTLSIRYGLLSHHTSHNLRLELLVCIVPHWVSTCHFGTLSMSINLCTSRNRTKHLKDSGHIRYLTYTSLFGMKAFFIHCCFLSNYRSHKFLLSSKQMTPNTIPVCRLKVNLTQRLDWSRLAKLWGFCSKWILFCIVGIQGMWTKNNE